MGKRILIPVELRVCVLAAGNEGHIGRETMVIQQRWSVWWPMTEQNLKQYVDSCLGCMAAMGVNTVSPMVERPTPEGV